MKNNNSPKTWLITGTSSGFGKVWMEYLLTKGENVIATIRKEGLLSEIEAKYPKSLQVLQLDVRDRKSCFDIVEKGLKHFGKIDVLINNAGYGQFGCIEELSEADVKDQMETNVYGSIWMIQAVLPSMRSNLSGRIIQVSSIGGLLSFPSVGMYNSSKFAVEGICEALAQEVAHCNIKVTLIEPGGYETDFGSRSARTAEVIETYNIPREARKKKMKPSTLGKPAATCDAIWNLAYEENPPLRLLMGIKPWTILEPEYESRMASWKENLDISHQTHG
ncbi:MAG: NADP-dependent 3-hydroxy acid dehydrogenase YdfG [Psychromonas sp.]|jgi:NADP-dependent 3-hydroxy acid dehydrogenase YdfG